MAISVILNELDCFFWILNGLFYIFLYTADLLIKVVADGLKSMNLTSASFSNTFVHTPHTHNHASANQTFVIVIELINVCRDAVYWRFLFLFCVLKCQALADSSGGNVKNEN